MNFKQYITQQLKSEKNKKRILFQDGKDPRAIQAALMHDLDGIIVPILLFETHVEKNAALKDLNIISTIVIEDYKDKLPTLAQQYFELRKGKETLEECEKAVRTKEYFGMMLLKNKEIDGVIGGLNNPTADILRPAFKIIGTLPGVKNISSVMIMERAHEWYIFTDISVIIQPTIEQIVDIAINASQFANLIDFKTKVAFLSFSTSGSAVHERSIMIREATVKFNETYKPAYKAIGEVQFDAAFDPEIRKSKYKDEGFTKNPTIFVFPSLEAGNIGYKIAQRMGGFNACGPIITGIAAPVNDLSRGATIYDVYMTALITAVQAKSKA